MFQMFDITIFITHSFKGRICVVVLVMRKGGESS